MAKAIKQRENSFVCGVAQHSSHLKPYDALKDPYLQAYFHLPSIRRHIKQFTKLQRSERNLSKRSRSKGKRQKDASLNPNRINPQAKPQSTTLMPYLIPRLSPEQNKVDQFYRQYSSLEHANRRRMKTKS